MADTHLYFLGEAALANGFRLAGFHVYHRTLYESDLNVLAELRGEGGRVLIAQVPPLHDPDAMHSPVDNRIAQLLGQSEGGL